MASKCSVTITGARPIETASTSSSRGWLITARPTASIGCSRRDIAASCCAARSRLLCELARSDRAVRELTALVGEPQSLVSYHLRELRNGELVRVHRSSADRRDSYYAIDLARCRDLLGASGAALHPGLQLTPT